MKKIVLLLLFCFLMPVVMACSPEQTSSKPADVKLVREYACELVNRSMNLTHVLRVSRGWTETMRQPFAGKWN